MPRSSGSAAQRRRGENGAAQSLRSSRQTGRAQHFVDARIARALLAGGAGIDRAPPELAAQAALAGAAVAVAGAGGDLGGGEQPVRTPAVAPTGERRAVGAHVEIAALVHDAQRAVVQRIGHREIEHRAARCRGAGAGRTGWVLGKIGHPQRGHGVVVGPRRLGARRVEGGPGVAEEEHDSLVDGASGVAIGMAEGEAEIGAVDAGSLGSRADQLAEGPGFDRWRCGAALALPPGAAAKRSRARYELRRDIRRDPARILRECSPLQARLS